ncbi:hypothetical protein GDO78_020573 [Eleutherodactylus coqui]|uniref:Uncharacterized protein n=1 Tax=Eleutherodactylus coqui TaxID=57060 RepID=A0A8J6E5Q5_ELECQ|nr:hypothetical protein GDO78_020573 [Eleutherodactylus coqui]
MTWNLIFALAVGHRRSLLLTIKLRRFFFHGLRLNKFFEEVTVSHKRKASQKFQTISVSSSEELPGQSKQYSEGKLKRMIAIA